MDGDPTLQEVQKEWHGTYRSYVVGLLFSLVLTTISFCLVILHIFPHQYVQIALIVLAVVQAAGQLVFFLHLGQEPTPRWETLIFCFTTLILLIIVIGTLWVMNDLNERTMSNMTNMKKDMVHD